MLYYSLFYKMKGISWLA